MDPNTPENKKLVIQDVSLGILKRTLESRYSNTNKESPSDIKNNFLITLVDLAPIGNTKVLKNRGKNSHSEDHPQVG